MVKNPPANAGDARDLGSIPGSGKSLKKEIATHFIFCAAGRVSVTVNFMCNLTQPQDTRVFG